MSKPPVIVITMGDPSGIGPEVIIKSFFQDRNLFKLCLPVVIGNYSVLNQHFLTFFRSENFFIRPIKSLEETLENKLCVIDVPETEPVERVEFGKIKPIYGRASSQYIKYAVELVKSEKIKSIVTAPVSKESIISSGIKFRGHTEYLAELTDSKNIAMLMVSDNYKVVLVTRHIPFKDVSRELTENLIINQVSTACATLKKYFRISLPRIAMCNLNPHKGEGGEIGTEEREKIIPAMEILRQKNYKVVGPLLTEDAFSIKSLNFQEQSLIVTYYHDQAMVPLKLLCGGKLVNVTCGLPFLRTSPAHGVAFDIAGKNIADPTSMTEAIKLACRLTH